MNAWNDPTDEDSTLTDKVVSVIICLYIIGIFFSLVDIFISTNQVLQIIIAVIVAGGFITLCGRN